MSEPFATGGTVPREGRYRLAHDLGSLARPGIDFPSASDDVGPGRRELARVHPRSPMPCPVPLASILPHIDTEALREIAEHQLAAGRTRGEVIDDIVAVVDALIPWAVIVPGPAGAAVEALDGPIARGIARVVVGVADLTRKRKSVSGAVPSRVSPA